MSTAWINSSGSISSGASLSGTSSPSSAQVSTVQFRRVMRVTGKIGKKLRTYCRRTRRYWLISTVSLVEIVNNVGLRVFHSLLYRIRNPTLEAGKKKRWLTGYSRDAWGGGELNDNSLLTWTGFKLVNWVFSTAPIHLYISTAKVLLSSRTFLSRSSSRAGSFLSIIFKLITLLPNSLRFANTPVHVSRICVQLKLQMIKKFTLP